MTEVHISSTISLGLSNCFIRSHSEHCKILPIYLVVTISMPMLKLGDHFNQGYSWCNISRSFVPVTLMMYVVQ